jgi:hypothetical protein
VRIEPVDVLGDASLFRHVISMVTSQLTAGPTTSELGKGWTVIG